MQLNESQDDASTIGSEMPISEGSSVHTTLGKAAGQGFAWVSLSIVLSKLLVSIALLVLAWIITQEDFALLAIISAVGAFIKIFHDGGISQVLVQRGADQFHRLEGTSFWMVLVTSSLAAVLLAISAPAIADFYDDSRLASLLQVLALSLPLGAPTAICRAKLQLDLRFQILSLLTTTRFALRSIGIVILAYLGFGVMSFVLPMLLVEIVEGMAAYYFTRLKPWRSSASLEICLSLLKDSCWIVFAILSRGLSRNGDYLVLGRLLAKDLVGQYYFAYQMTVQIVWLFAVNLRNVLFPVISRLVDQPERLATAILRTVRMLMFVISPLSMVAAVVVRPMEKLVFGGKWAAAVPIMEVFSAVSPFLIFSDLVYACLIARGSFRRSGYLTLAEGCWLMFSAWLAVQLGGTENILAISCWIFGLVVGFVIVLSTIVFRSFGIRPTSYIAAFLPHWVLALLAAGIAVYFGQKLSLENSPLLQILVQATVCSLSFALLALLFMRAELQELATVAPRPVAGFVRRVFFLGSPPSMKESAPLSKS